MRTVFVTGADTGIGKTHVAAAIGRLLWSSGLRVQFVKPVETGRTEDESGDADAAAEGSGIEGAAAFTLARFRLPLAPMSAAAAEGSSLSLNFLLEKWRALPAADLRVVEGAGGLAVPIGENGTDWRGFARAIDADRVVLVTPDRLGGINQARLVAAYARSAGLPAGIWLNETAPQSEEVRQSNREGVSSLPLWATQRYRAPLPEDPGRARDHLAL